MRLCVATGAVVALVIVSTGAVTSLMSAEAAEDTNTKICAATSVEAVDDLLSEVTDIGLLDSLDGLLKVDVASDADSPTLTSSTQLDDVKRRLNCDGSSRPFKNCDEVRRAGLDPISKNHPRFQSKLDKDGDGVGCESDEDDSKDDDDEDSRDDDDSDDSDDNDSESDDDESDSTQVVSVPTDAPETGN